MTVYLDLVMLLNFMVDYFLLLGTNRLSGFPPAWRRAALAAGLGSLYSGMCMLPSFRFLGNLLWRLVCLGLMGGIAFGLDRSAVKRTGVFVLLSMAMGGIAVGAGSNDFMMLILSALGVWMLCRLGFGNSVGGREYVPITVTEGRHKVELIALKDSGNTLRDPITGEQVLILGPEQGKVLTGLDASAFSAPLDTMMAYPGFRLIPYRAVGQSGGMLLAKRFDKVSVGKWNGSALVAFAPEQIGKGEVFQALTGGMV